MHIIVCWWESNTARLQQILFSVKRYYDASDAAGIYEHTELEFSVGWFGDWCGWCFWCGWRVSTVIEFLWLLIFGFWLSFGLWLSALDLRHILILGFRLPSVFDARFLTSLDSRFWPFSGFDSRLRTLLGLVNSSATEKNADPFIEMGVFGVLSVCVSMQYTQHSRLRASLRDYSDYRKGFLDAKTRSV